MSLEVITSTKAVSYFLEITIIRRSKVHMSNILNYVASQIRLVTIDIKHFNHEE